MPHSTWSRPEEIKVGELVRWVNAPGDGKHMNKEEFFAGQVLTPYQVRQKYETGQYFKGISVI